MIGSHNSFTYLKPSCWIFRLFSRWWKTQNKNLDEQYALGVRMFDIRVYKHKGLWQFCHGIVNLKSQGFSSLKDICEYMSSFYPDAIYRIVLEKGNVLEFVKDIYTDDSNKSLTELFPNLWRVDVKRFELWNGYVCNNNQSLYDRGYLFALVNTWEHPSYEFCASVNIKNWWEVDIKRTADRIYSTWSAFFHDKIEDKKNLCMIDYVR